jgi:hypothetical protein
MFQMRHLSSILVLAAAAGVTGSAAASWVKTYDFNDAASWTNGSASAGYWSASGFGQGLIGRSFNVNSNSSYESGAMRMTVTNGGFGGGRLYLNGSGSQTTAQVRQEFVDAMAAQWAPETSIDISSTGTGVVAFLAYAVPVGGNPLLNDPASSANANASIGLTIDFSQQKVFLGAAFTRTSGGFALQTGWNSLKIGLTSAGIINYYLNSQLIGSASGTYDYLANAADGAINLYGDTYFSTGYATPTGNVSALFDNLVVSSTIPAPGAISMLGLAGLSVRRRRN